MSNALEDHYNRNANATGHTTSCRRRLPPTGTNDHRALDPGRCPRCLYLTKLLDDAHALWAQLTCHGVTQLPHRGYAS